MWIWPLQTGLSVERGGGAGLTVGSDNLKGLFQTIL